MMAIWDLPYFRSMQVGDDLVDLISVRLRSGMPRYLPPFSSLSASLAYIGFFAGALRIHVAQVGLVEAVGRDALQVQRAELVRAGVRAASSRHVRVSRSNVAPANVVRVIRWVRFGRAGDDVQVGVGDDRRRIGAVGVLVDEAVDLVAARALAR